ncbi:uncharacterized protein [Diadema setosum]|uniref:uncharacterized protein n=1 Tax=Diadema setosum TaxID=31175 RepID=UPI003B39FD2C
MPRRSENSPMQYGVRLFGSESNDTKKGLLQIRTGKSGSWLFFDADSLGLTGARLACRQLGFPYLCSKSAEVVPGITEDDIFSLDVHCLGEEASLDSCPTSGRGVQPSRIQSVASFSLLSITCANEDDITLRLVNGSSQHQGTVEYKCSSHPEWLNVCFDDWYPAAADTLCATLGFRGTVDDVGITLPTAPLSDIGFICSARQHEDHLFDCMMTEAECVSGHAASVSCGLAIEVYGEETTLCDASHTCRGSCGNSTRAGCRCDEDCTFFNDCCFDFVTECGADDIPEDHSVKPSGSSLDVSVYSCEKPLGGLSQIYAGSEGYYLIRQCPPTTESSLREQCIGSGGSLDVIRNLPVYDSDGNSYFNVFCAVCHGKSLSDLTPWRIEAEPAENFISSEMIIYYVVLPPWDDSKRTRPCFRDGSVVDTCPSSLANSSLAEACRAYQAPLRDSTGTFAYRNPHCFQCQDDWNGQLPIEYCTGCECQGASCFLRCAGTRSGRLTSVTLLFDFMESDRTECTGIGEVYDMFLKRCRVLVCPEGMTYDHGTCVYSLQNTTVHSTVMDCLSSAIASSLPQVLQIIIEKNVTSDTHWANIFAEDVHRAESIDLTLASVFATSNQHVRPFCNLTRVSLMAPHMHTNDTPSSCSDIVRMPLADESLRIIDTWYANSSGWNRTQLVFNDYRFVRNSTEYSSNPPSEDCWFELFNILLCNLQIYSNEQFVIDEENVAHHVPSGVSLAPEEYFLLRNGSIVTCPDSLNMAANIQSIIYMTGASASVIFLMATLVTYATFPKLRNVAGKCLMNVTVALLGANLIFVLNPLFSLERTLCTVVAALAHFFWLSVFCWMNVVGINMARTFGWTGSSSLKSDRGCSKGTLISYALYGWGIPFLIVAACTAIHICQCAGMRFQYGSSLVCWIDGEERALLYGVTVPIYVAIFLNVLLLAYTAISLIRHRREGRSLRAHQTQIFSENVVIVAKLSVVLGTAWIFGFAYSFTDGNVVMYIFVTLTSLQGTFLFLFFGATKRIRDMWRSKFKKEKITSVFTVKVNSSQRSTGSSNTGSTSM